MPPDTTTARSSTGRPSRPVTQREYEFPDGVTLLSATDPSSHISYANGAFVRTSGYTSDELLGQPHNLVRHPDMPREAFADMWRSLKLGQSWTALVKNRRKDGDHYWVRANATPMRRGGRVVGYLSVRTKPSRAEVEGAEALYQRFRNGQTRGLAFHCGLIVHTGWSRWRSSLQLMPTVWRVRAPLLLSAALAAAMLVTVGAGAGTATLALLAAALLVAPAVTSAWIESQVTKPLQRMVAVAQQVASGEPVEHPPLDRIDDIGMLLRAINQAGLNLRSLVDDVQEQSTGIASASQQIAAATSHLSGRTEQSASNLEETASSMEQMTATVRQNADSAGEANRLATSASETAAKGGAAVSDVVSTMALISQASQRIADIIGVIDGIAFQTNILALNAAVEAARAGEQGRGFAVVASEVRGLAQRSAQAAREIKALIADSVDKVESGARTVSSAGETMSDVVTQVRRVSALVAEITHASSEQSSGIAQVSQAVNQLDQMTQQNAAMVEESSAAAASMREQAARLTQAVRVFSMT
ncbi:MAG: PAS domain-containing protein [Rhizobacter sp.]|nr:PAS domain-containing protein [Rhizobacter sp.]